MGTVVKKKGGVNDIGEKRALLVGKRVCILRKPEIAKRLEERGEEFLDGAGRVSKKSK